MNGGQIFGLVLGLTVLLCTVGLLVYLVRKYQAQEQAATIVSQLLARLDSVLDKRAQTQTELNDLEGQRRDIEQKIELVRAVRAKAKEQNAGLTDAQIDDALRRRGLLK